MDDHELEPDFPQTGSPRQLSGILPSMRGSTQTPRPRPSAITGPHNREREAERPTGLQPGETGAVATPPGRWVSEKLGQFTLPEETTRSLSNSLISHLVTTTSSRFSADGQFDGTKLGPFCIKRGWDRASLTRDLADVRASCQPARKADVVNEVAKLTVRTKSRALGEGENRLMAETLVADLSAYPIDVVRFACEYWVDGGSAAKFTPSWPELKEICDKRMDGRLRLRRALEYTLSEPSSEVRP